MIDPFLVDVMRSCELAHVGAERRLVADRGGNPPEERGDLRARLLKRKMLSMKSRTSWRISSRKYSATVAPRAPRGARARRFVHLAEDDRGLGDDARLLHFPVQSVPSRVRSPTPANTENPLCSVAMLRISS